MTINEQYNAIHDAILNLKKTHYYSNDEELMQVYENQVMTWLKNYNYKYHDVAGLVALYNIAFDE